MLRFAVYHKNDPEKNRRGPETGVGFQQDFLLVDFNTGSLLLEFCALFHERIVPKRQRL